jgi:ElaB/YqjD/DUF883 family membrane-anchored ribosome-binding protein
MPMGTAKSTTRPFADAPSRLAEIKGTVEKTAREAASKVGDNLSMVGDKMQARPLLAIGIALGVGFLVGRLMAR